MAAEKKTARLPNSFFKDNQLMEMSAASLAYFTIMMMDIKELDQSLAEVIDPHMDDDRRERIAAERQRIEAVAEPEELVEIMRKGYDFFNKNILCAKALSDQERVMPLLMKRYSTTSVRSFIEVSTIIFAKGDRKYAQELRAMYSDIRNPYARACACLVFGIQGMEEEIPFLAGEYEKLRNVPNETCGEHPLLALHILHGKM